jgi:hypothetical protein
MAVEQPQVVWQPHAHRDGDTTAIQMACAEMTDRLRCAFLASFIARTERHHLGTDDNCTD